MTAEEEEVKYKGKIVSPGVDLVCVSHFTLTRTLTERVLERPHSI